MAQPTNTYDTYDNIGIREDLSDMIYNISPTETPCLTGFKRTKASNTYHEWQTDALAAAAANAVVEGDEATLDAAVATVRMGNYTQISDKTAVVTGTVEATNRAGRGREMAYQIAKKSAELKRDMEYTICGVNNARVAGNATTARELGSLDAYIYTNDDFGATGASPTGTGASSGSTARTDGTQRAFTEDLLKTVLQNCWTAGGEPSVIMVGAFNKRVASTFTGGATRFDKSEDKKLVASVDVYVSDWGELRFVPNRFSRSRTAYVLQMDMWKLAYLRPFSSHALSKTGDTEKRQIIVEYTLVSCNEGASGMVADLTTS